MQLYIIRHAQSYNNALANFKDRICDPHLTDLGHQQAAAVADYLATGVHPEQKYGGDADSTGVRTVLGVGITRLYCSAMYRSLQTAHAIGRALDLNPEVWLDIHESGGIYLEHQDERGVVGYPGKTRAEILAEFPHVILPDTVTEAGWWDVRAGQEDWPACQGRAIRVAYQLREWAASSDRAGDCLAMVSHGGFMDALIKALVYQLPAGRVVYHHFNTAITRIDFVSEERLDIRYVNRIPHLSQELVS